jgi:hypothetical protein
MKDTTDPYVATTEQFERLQRELAAAQAENERLTAALTKISAIRDSIVGCQGFNFSEHAYPLVAALDAAGFEGACYEIASKNLGTLIERANKAEAEVDRMRPVYEAAKEWQGARCTRMPYCDPYDGSHDAECLLAIAESRLTNAIEVATASEGDGG